MAERLGHVGPVLGDVHEGGNGLRGGLGHVQVVAEDRVAEQLARDPVRRSAAHVHEVLVLVGGKLALHHHLREVLVPERLGALRVREHARGHLRELGRRALGPPRRVLRERQRAHVDGHRAGDLVVTGLLQIAPHLEVAGRPAHERDVLEPQPVDELLHVGAMGHVVVAVDRLCREALAARVDGDHAVAVGEVLDLVLEDLAGEGEAGNKDDGVALPLVPVVDLNVRVDGEELAFRAVFGHGSSLGCIRARARCRNTTPRGGAAAIRMGERWLSGGRMAEGRRGGASC